MITKEGCIKIMNFMTPETGVLVLGHGHISHILKIISLNTFSTPKHRWDKLCICN